VAKLKHGTGNSQASKR